jgi:hypothetical protein
MRERTELSPLFFITLLIAKAAAKINPNIMIHDFAEKKVSKNCQPAKSNLRMKMNSGWSNQNTPMPQSNRTRINAMLRNFHFILLSFVRNII